MRSTDPVPGLPLKRLSSDAWGGSGKREPGRGPSGSAGLGASGTPVAPNGRSVTACADVSVAAVAAAVAVRNARRCICFLPDCAWSMSMMPKSGYRFSGNILLHEKVLVGRGRFCDRRMTTLRPDRVGIGRRIGYGRVRRIRRLAEKIMPDPTQALAQFAASLTYDAIPVAAREHTKDLLLDALACALAGHQGEETSQVEALAAALAQSAETSVIGGGHLSLAGASLLNGYLITAVTMCAVHRPTLTHIPPEAVPPALAIAERDGCSGRDLLVALAAGCEVMTRIGLGLDWPAARARGWH